MQPSIQRDRLFANYERGTLGSDEVIVLFVELLLDADDDADALMMCHALPTWFREHFRNSLQDCQASGFGQRHWASIGESRTMEDIESDAKRHGEILERLAPEILQLI